jgi:enoyl-CoA hydratase/carnithine racemase
LERTGGLARVALSQPKKLNAMTKAMWGELAAAFEALNADESVRCVLVSGDGRGFCPGNDIGEFETERSTPELARALSAIMNRGRQAMLDCPHPVVARIQGPCVGGGLEIACYADIRIASETATFGAPLNRLGLSMAYEEMQPIWRLVGKTAMFEFLVEGRLVTAHEALRMGLVNRVTAPCDLDSQVETTLTAIMEGPPLVNRWHKKFLRRLDDPRPLMDADHDEHYLAFATQDYVTGYRAFLAKAKPEFVGR